MTRRRHLYLIRTPKPPTLPTKFAALRASQIAEARAERRRLTCGPYDQQREAA